MLLLNKIRFYYWSLFYLVKSWEPYCYWLWNAPCLFFIFLFYLCWWLILFPSMYIYDEFALCIRLKVWNEDDCISELSSSVIIKRGYCFSLFMGESSPNYASSFYCKLFPIECSSSWFILFSLPMSFDCN